MPKISIILPCHKLDYGLGRAIEALRHQDFREPYEIIVANDGDDEAVRKFCQDAGLLCVPSLPGGSSYRARNQGVAQAKGEVFAFIDSNKVAHPGWLTEGLTCLTKAGAGYAAGPVVTVPHPKRGRDGAYWLQRVVSFPIEKYLRTSHFGVTGNLFITRAAWEAVGPFHPGLFSGGDYDWGQRAHAAGVRQVYAGRALVEVRARSLEEFRTKQRRIVAGRLALSRQEGRRFSELLPITSLVRVALGRDTLPAEAARIADMPRWRIAHIVLLGQSLKWSNLWYSLKVRITRRLGEDKFY